VCRFVICQLIEMKLTKKNQTIWIMMVKTSIGLGEEQEEKTGETTLLSSLANTANQIF
jgi:hypothetical protein